MTSRTFLGGCVIAAAAIGGCYTGVDPTQPNRAVPATTATTTVDGTHPADPSMITGVPCDVAQVLATECASCHSATPTGGAPNAMMTYDDLMASSQNDPSMDIAAMSVQRMQDTARPMPPDGANPASAAVLDGWIKAGMPASTETCNATPANSIYDTASVCTTAKTWTQGERKSDLMLPGEACNQCHDKGRGPSLFASGTVYKTAHEPDDCYGMPAGTKVVITGADNKSVTVTVNSAGNFYFQTAPKLPYKAKVVSADGKKSRAMSGLQKSGDCNLCHTEKGTRLAGDPQQAAPGRIMAP